MATASQIEEIKATLQRGLENLALSGNLKPLPLRQQVGPPRLKSQLDPRRYSDSFPRRQSPLSKPGSRESTMSQRSNSMINIAGTNQHRRPLSAKGVEIPRPHRTPNGMYNHGALRTPPSRGRLGSEGSLRSNNSTPSMSGRPLAAKQSNRIMPSPPQSPNKSKGALYLQSGAAPKQDVGVMKRVNGDGMVARTWAEEDGEEWSDIDENEEDSLDTPAR